MIHDTEALVIINLSLTDIIRAHERPDSPLGVIAQDILSQALEIRIVSIAQAIVGPSGHPEAELGE